MPTHPALPASLFRFLGRVQFTMVLLIVGVVVMALGTVIESRSGALAAQTAVYRSSWFDLYLVLIVVNLVVAVINRIPIQRSQWAFVLTHFAIVVLMAGAWISRTFGFEGQLAVREGATENRIWLDDAELRVRWPGSAGQAFFLGRNSGLQGRAFTMAAAGNPTLRIDRFEAQGEYDVQLATGGAADVAGVELHLIGQGSHGHEWLLADHREFGRRSTGSLDLEFRSVSSEDQVPAAMPGSPASVAVVEVRQSEEAPPVRIELPRDLGKPVELGGLVQATVKQFLLRARVAPGGLVENPSAPLNPAAVVEIRRGADREDHTLFSAFPQFNLVKGREGKAPLVAGIGLRASGAGQRPLVTILVHPPTGRLWVQVSTASGRGAAVQVQPGVGAPLLDVGRELEVQRYLPHAKAEPRVTRGHGKDAGEPWMHVSVTHGAATGGGWLRFGATETIDCAGRALSLTWDRKPYVLPFAVTLEAFDIGFHPGSARPSQFSSRIKVRDQRGQETRTTISMNRPLDLAGFRLFQSSYRRGDHGEPDTTFLTVSCDPGVAVVYPSFALLIVGVAWYLLGSSRRHRMATESATAAPQPESPV